MHFILSVLAILVPLLFAPAALADDGDPPDMTFTLWHSDEGQVFGEGSREGGIRVGGRVGAEVQIAVGMRQVAVLVSGDGDRIQEEERVIPLLGEDGGKERGDGVASWPHGTDYGRVLSP